MVFYWRCSFYSMIVLRFVVSHVKAAPCDIYAASSSPCVAAHSVSRALYDDFDGPLYEVERASDKKHTDVGLLESGGVVNVSIVDSFCKDDDCVISQIYDQSENKNHLLPSPAGGAWPFPCKPVNATRSPFTISGHRAYAAYFEGSMGYRIEKTKKIAINDEPETMYMVTAGDHYNGGCCFDYGNAETDAHDDGKGTMEAVYFGNSKGWGRGGGNGPWIMADLENGLWAGSEQVNPNNTAIANDGFVTAMVKGNSGGFFALKGGDAQKSELKTLYDGPRPPNYTPMKKQGSIILGIGGDNSHMAVGTFFEGVMTQGYSTDAADNAVQADIQAASYGV
eukprot:g761.t1